MVTQNEKKKQKKIIIILPTKPCSSAEQPHRSHTDRIMGSESGNEGAEASKDAKAPQWRGREVTGRSFWKGFPVLERLPTWIARRTIFELTMLRYTRSCCENAVRKKVDCIVPTRWMVHIWNTPKNGNTKEKKKANMVTKSYVFNSFCIQVQERHFCFVFSRKWYLNLRI